MRMSHVDQAKDLSCQITVYTSRLSSGDLLADFFSEWTAIIGSPFPEAGELSEEKARIVGVARAVPVSGPNNYVRLITYSAGAKMASIELVTPTLAAYESYRPTVDSFLASVSVNSAASGTPPIDAGQQAQEGQQEQAHASRTDTSPTPQTERAEGSALPSSQDDPGSDPAVAGAQYVAPGASCRATLACYTSCEMVEDCLRPCDQRAGADDVALAHASVSCIADSGCGADQDCVVQRCASELTACTEIAIAPSAPAGTPQTGGAAVASGSLDLVYSLPSGWTEQRGADWITLNYSVAGPSPTESYTLVILPSKPLSGTLTATFQALWAEMITPTFTPLQDPAIVPAPMRRRLASGFVAAFDGGLMKTNNGGMFTTMLYLISSGDRVVPILGMYGLLGDQSEPVLSAFFDSVSISGQTPVKAPLFDASELVGKWSTQETGSTSRFARTTRSTPTAPTTRMRPGPSTAAWIGSRRRARGASMTTRSSSRPTARRSATASSESGPTGASTRCSYRRATPAPRLSSSAGRAASATGTTR